MIWLVEIFVVEVMFLMREKNIDFSCIFSGTQPLDGTKIILIVNQDKKKLVFAPGYFFSYSRSKSAAS